MIKLKRIAAYPTPGKSNLNHLKGKKGVYIIFEEYRGQRKIVYIGHSQRDLYQIITRHFQSWDDPTQRRVTYTPGRKKYSVQVILANHHDIPILEKTFIYNLRPRDNELKYESIINDIDQGRIERVGNRLKFAKLGKNDQKQEQYKYNDKGELMEKVNGKWQVVF